ncbi:MAG: type II secretion system F family protein [Anaerolineales bacterium]|nr:type II secretion system F family protein [Anaerolineales bacterium]
MPDLLPYHLFFGLMATLGGWLLVVGVRHGTDRHPAVPLNPSSAPPAEPAEEVSALPGVVRKRWSQPVSAAGRRLLGQRDSSRLEDRLRRSGWRYGSVGDYYGSKIATAVTFFVAGAMSCLLLGFPAPGLTLIAAALGAWGLFLPDLELRGTLRERREALYREMAWTLDRVALVMGTGEALESALHRVAGDTFGWLSGGAGGLFTALLRDIAAGLATQRHDVAALLADVRRGLPEDIPELDEFLQAVQLNLEKRQPIVEPLRALARTMRDRLNNRVEELAQKAELKVVALTSGVIVPALLVVVLGAAVLGFVTNF